MKIIINWFDEDSDANFADRKVIYNVLDAEATIERMAKEYQKRQEDISEGDRSEDDNEVAKTTIEV